MNKRKLALTTALLAVGISLPLRAQFTDAKSASAGVTNRPSAGAALPSGAKSTRLGQEESVTSEQRKVYDEALAGTREEMQAVSKKMQLTRQEMMALTRAEKIDEEAIRAKAAALGKLEGDLAILNAKIYAKLGRSTNAGQMEKLRRSMALQPRPPGSGGTNLPVRAPAGAVPKDK